MFFLVNSLVSVFCVVAFYKALFDAYMTCNLLWFGWTRFCGLLRWSFWIPTKRIVKWFLHGQPCW